MKKLNRFAALLLCGAIIFNPTKVNAEEAEDTAFVETSIESDLDTVTVKLSLAEAATNGIVSLSYDENELKLVDSDVEKFADLVDFNEDSLSIAFVSKEAVEVENFAEFTFKAVNAYDGATVSVNTNLEELYVEDELVASNETTTSTETLELLAISDIADVEYTGNVICPAVTVTCGDKTLTKKEYTVRYSDNAKVGTAKVTVTGKGKYAGYSVTKEFNIVGKKVTSKNSSMSVFSTTISSKTSGVLIGTSIDVDGKTVRSTNYKYVVTDANGKAVSSNVVKTPGTYKLTATFSGNYSGSISKTFTVTRKEIKLFGKVLGYTWSIK